MNPRRRRLLFATVLGLPGSRLVAAQTPLRLLVPGDVGGVLDIRARWLAHNLIATIGRTVRVENVPGAAGLLGMRAARAGPRDGSLMVVVHQGTLAINPHLYPEPGYDALNDFLPLSRMGHGPLIIVVPSQSSVSSLTELLIAAKQRTLSFASPGAGTPPHLAARLFAQSAGVELLHVPFKGGGQAMSALLGGQVDFAVEGATAVRPQVASGKLKALAHTGRLPVPGWPQLSAAAQWLAGFEYEAWTGLALPAGTPESVLFELHAAVMKVLRTPSADRWFEDRGASIGSGTAAEFAALIRKEHLDWGIRIRTLGLRADASG